LATVSITDTHYVFSSPAVSLPAIASAGAPVTNAEATAKTTPTTPHFFVTINNTAKDVGQDGVTLLPAWAQEDVSSKDEVRRYYTCEGRY